MFHLDGPAEVEVGEGVDDGALVGGGAGALEGVEGEFEGGVGVQGPVGAGAVGDGGVEGGEGRGAAPEFVDGFGEDGAGDEGAGGGDGGEADDAVGRLGDELVRSRVL